MSELQRLKGLLPPEMQSWVFVEAAASADPPLITIGPEPSSRMRRRSVRRGMGESRQPNLPSLSRGPLRRCSHLA